MPYDVEAAADAAIMEIAQAFGTRTDKVAPIVDEYGCELSLAALKTVQGEMRDGYRPSSPFGYMISLLRKGVIQVAVMGAADPTVDWLHDRYHNAQANRDTPAKRLAREAEPTQLVVKCPCGEEFPSAVSG